MGETDDVIPSTRSYQRRLPIAQDLELDEDLVDIEV